jgi:6-methylsalicylate decarboxylase
MPLPYLLVPCWAGIPYPRYNVAKPNKIDEQSTLLEMTGTDFHQHAWPDGVRRLLERRREPPYLRGRVLTLPVGGAFEVDPDAYLPEARLTELDRSGLERAVVSLPPTSEPTADLIEVWHEEGQALRQASGGRLVPLAYEAALPGFGGTVVGAPFFADGAGSRDLLTALERLGQFVFVHPAAAPAATGPAWLTSGIDYTHQMLAAYAAWLGGLSGRHDRLRVVFALLGGGAPFQLERFVRRGLDPRAPFVSNVWFDTSSYGERALELSLQTFGARRLVFGSDAPVDAVADARAGVARFGSALELELLVSNPLVLLTPEKQRWAA